MLRWCSLLLTPKSHHMTWNSLRCLFTHMLNLTAVQIAFIRETDFTPIVDHSNIEIKIFLCDQISCAETPQEVSHLPCLCCPHAARSAQRAGRQRVACASQRVSGTHWSRGWRWSNHWSSWCGLARCLSHTNTHTSTHTWEIYIKNHTCGTCTVYFLLRILTAHFLLQTSRTSSFRPALSALAMPPRKMEMNHSSEYWYMGSMLARSATQKNRICVLMATGMYRLRVSSMSFSVCSAMITLACVAHTKDTWVTAYLIW